MMQDGLGSVRSVVDNSSGVEWSGSPDPFGSYFGEAGTRQTPYGFTGEYTDPITGMVHLRARDYHPALGVFPALDPFEGVRDEPMSINRYSYVQGNPVNWIDSTGNCPQDPWFNDLPGQRCIWLANELSQHYGWPLDVLMQKDVLELETIYTFGNANNTFNESSWSQSVRNIVNDNLPAIVLGTAGIVVGTIATISTGGATLPVVIAALGAVSAGVLGGGLGGAAFGTAYGASMYQIAISGQCGCQTQQEVLRMGEGAFVALAREQGTIYGGLTGGLFASGSVGQVFAGAGGIIQGGQGIYNAGQNIAANGINTCNVINGLLSVLGIIGGISSANRGYTAWQTQRFPYTYRPPASAPIGRRYSEMEQVGQVNIRTTIFGRSYSGHVLDQMQARGIMPLVVENTIRTGQKFPSQIPGRIVFYDATNNITVVTDSSASIIITTRMGSPSNYVP